MRGIGVSPGIAVGKAYILRKSNYSITSSENNSELAELEKFAGAVALSTSEINNLLSSGDLGVDDSLILSSQLDFLLESNIVKEVSLLIESRELSAPDALLVISRQQMSKADLAGLPAPAIQDICNRILKHLNSSSQPGELNLNNECILIAEDIDLEEYLQDDLYKVIGLATAKEGKNGHAVGLARSKGIPGVIGCGDALQLIKNNDVIILDGSSGMVLINPDSRSLFEYQRLRENYLRMSEVLESLMNVSAVTKDGKGIMLWGNISDVEDMEAVLKRGGQGAGLYRTESIFLGRDDYPGEEEQYVVYRDVARSANGHPVYIRTLDIGSERKIPYSDLTDESNPLLGWRSIRVSLERPGIFITQLKAILRANESGNLKLMFPMISGLEQLSKAKLILQEAKEQLEQEDIAFSKDIEIGVLIEIPSAALCADLIAKEVDFMSIGTNDLCQYTVGVDRHNSKVRYLYDYLNPGLLRLIHNIILEGKKHQIPVSLCGEMAADTMLTPLFLGMGLEELSMNALSIPYVKEAILRTNVEEARICWEEVSKMDNSGLIRNYLLNLSSNYSIHNS